MKRETIIASPLESDKDGMRPIEAARHIAKARLSLSCLGDRLGGRHQWPELDKAIIEMEIALSILTTESGGML